MTKNEFKMETMKHTEKEIYEIFMEKQWMLAMATDGSIVTKLNTRTGKFYVTEWAK